MPLASGPLHKMADEELFTIDLTGDDKGGLLKTLIHHLNCPVVRQRVKTKKPLISTLILSQRSAVPAIYSRVGQDKKKDPITRAEKERLLRIGKRKRVGQSNALVDPTEVGRGSALLEPTEAVKKSGTYDVWMDVDDERDSGNEFDSIMQTKAVKVRSVILLTIVLTALQPRTQPLRDLIFAPAIPSPHQGASYNPPVDAYKELLNDAVQVEQKKDVEAKKYEDIKATMESARRPVHGYEVPVAEGMIIDVPGDDQSQDEADVQEESMAPNKVARRKTQQQRRKALRVLEEVSPLSSTPTYSS